MTDKQKILWTYLQKTAFTLPGEGLVEEGAKGAGKAYLWFLKNLVVPTLLLGPPAVGALAGVAHTKLTSPTEESEQVKLRELEARELAKVLAAVRRKKQLAQQKKAPDVGKPLYI